MVTIETDKGRAEGVTPELVYGSSRWSNSTSSADGISPITNAVFSLTIPMNPLALDSTSVFHLKDFICLTLNTSRRITLTSISIPHRSTSDGFVARRSWGLLGELFVWLAGYLEKTSAYASTLLSKRKSFHRFNRLFIPSRSCFCVHMYITFTLAWSSPSYVRGLFPMCDRTMSNEDISLVVLCATFLSGRSDSEVLLGSYAEMLMLLIMLRH